MSADAIAIADRIADDLLLPRAPETDRSELVPRDLLDALADAGLYGLAGPPELAPDLAPGGHLTVIERLASGCLSTTLVWLQHHGAVIATAAAPALAERWLEPLCRGRVRAGVAFSGLRRRGGGGLAAVRADDGWRLTGNAPWVSGWGRIDVIRVAARHGDDIVWALIDAAEGPTLRVRPLRLAAMNATGTVTMDFEDHVVDDERVLELQPFAEWEAQDGTGPAVRINGALSLGVARRSCALLGASAYDAELARCRTAMAEAGDDAIMAVRAWAADLATRSALALVAAGGGRSLGLDQHAQRLGREAMFVLVFGQTAALREAQLARLGARG